MSQLPASLPYYELVKLVEKLIEDVEGLKDYLRQTSDNVGDSQYDYRLRSR